MPKYLGNGVTSRVACNMGGHEISYQEQEVLWVPLPDLLDMCNH